MKKLTAYISRANNITFNAADYAEPKQIEFNSPQELFDHVKQQQCRVRRDYCRLRPIYAPGRYTMKMATNDFKKHAK